MSLAVRRPEGLLYKLGLEAEGGSRWRYESRVRNGGEASIGYGKQGRRRCTNDVDMG